MLEILVLLLFGLLLFLIFLYSLSQLQLLISYYRKRKSDGDDTQPPEMPDFEALPHVTVQLPLYNEKTVVERLLLNIARLEYPRKKLEVQVLDDSTDDSAQLSKNLVVQLQTAGLDIIYLARSHRKDFKAGALREGLKVAKGEFIAIFDSDFLPQSDWLLKTIPHFQDETLGMVQTRWGHLNRDYSLLTKVQAFALDYHFILEQNGRSFAGCFINFNGTAGIWRKQCILEAGNWQGDTLTEDLDLSYRGQLRRWKFKYLEAVETPAELPITLQAARSQQFRWNKGAAENFQKNFKKILKDQNLPVLTKLHCFFHLLNSSLFLLVLGLSVLSFPVLFLSHRPEYSLYFDMMFLFGLGTGIFFISYWVSFSRIHGKGWRDFISYIGMFFSFFSIAMGFSLHNSIGVVQGHLGRQSEFVRTPKFNLAENISPSSSPTTTRIFGVQLFFEILLWGYFGLAIVTAFWLRNYSFLFFHLMLFMGFGFVVLQSLRELSRNRTQSSSYPQDLP